MNKETFRVEVDGRSFEIGTNGELISIDGMPIDASVTRISGETYSILVNGQSHEFTVEAKSVQGVAQVFSSNLAFGTYPMQVVQ